MLYRICLVLALALFLFVFWKYVFGAWVLREVFGESAASLMTQNLSAAAPALAPSPQPEANSQPASPQSPVSDNGLTQFPTMGVSIRLPATWQVVQVHSADFAAFTKPSWKYLVCTLKDSSANAIMAKAEAPGGMGIAWALAYLNDGINGNLKAVNTSFTMIDQQPGSFNGYPANVVDYSVVTNKGWLVHSRRIIFYAQSRLYVFDVSSPVDLPQNDSELQSIADSLTINPSSP